jgi:hypothetical protein
VNDKQVEEGRRERGVGKEQTVRLRTGRRAVIEKRLYTG